RARPPAMAVAPGGVVDATRAALLLADLAPRLDARARTARADLNALAEVRAATATERLALEEARAASEAGRAKVERLIAEKAALETRLSGDAARASAEADVLAARARSIRELIAALEARNLAPPAPAARPRGDALRPRLKPNRERTASPPLPFTPESLRFSDARGALAPPAAGRIIAAFGERGAAGDGAGLVIRTRPAAQVSSPFDGRVEYAGPFRGYGTLLILNVGGGYHIVVAGLSTVYGAVGQTVLSGEPVGAMPDQDQPPPDLYFEVRKDGEPLDPAPWLRG
ncbi:MAG: peptidoglycan DD-metalloendopeptidase family protein, partial [Caulobacterales bacterium]|nr:peptidoglycan DD-metalloendopeptidase family protein [Caulobacterales bacterium]